MGGQGRNAQRRAFFKAHRIRQRAGKLDGHDADLGAGPARTLERGVKDKHPFANAGRVHAPHPPRG